MLDGMIGTVGALSEENSARVEQTVSSCDYLLAGWLEWDSSSAQLQYVVCRTFQLPHRGYIVQSP